MHRLVLLGVLCGSVAACEPTMQDFADRCAGYGFQPGTEAMATCLQNETLAYKQRESAALAAAAQANATTNAAYRPWSGSWMH